MYRNQFIYLFFLLAIIGSFAFTNNFNRLINEIPIAIPPSLQRQGDPSKGYNYLTTGDFLKSGMPYSYFKILFSKDKHNYLNRTGKNAYVPAGFNVVQSPSNVEVVVPTCLQCHAQVFDGKLYVGLGNTFQDFSNISEANNIVSNLGASLMKTFDAKKYAAALPIFNAFDAVLAYMQTEVRGVNSADKLATLLVAHRDPQTLEWKNKPILDIPSEVIPTDVPAWWLLKKKNGMFYNGFGRGDFGKFLMLSNILTVKDSSEAREVNSHFGDVLAYIKSINPPKYPKAINTAMADDGKVVFANNCSKCHGKYGNNESYPNLLIPESIIKTDSLLYASNQQNPQFIAWFNKSWFSQGENPASMVPFNGYIAPPLDGIWITAPYLHNGSVPNLHALLNSKERPTYWKRNFKKPEYDYEKIGWVYENVKKPKRRVVYNTTLPGYSNEGHLFGDKLTETERMAVIEYLKTL
jgi:cytochrome c553